jgi:hypothetical protein
MALENMGVTLADLLAWMNHADELPFAKGALRFSL